MKNVGQILIQDHKLLSLIQPENFCGWIYSIDYDSASVMTNDLWKSTARGIPHNCFLVAATFDPDASKINAIDFAEEEVILLRVVGSARLPQDDDNVRAKIDNFQDHVSPDEDTGMDDLTQNQMQFGGLQCRVLGTFYMKGSDLKLGSDLESFASAARLKVYRPRGKALHTIVNYVDPIRRKKAQEEAEAMGIKKVLGAFNLGTVRYTSTDRLHRADDKELVPVGIQPSDFLSRRTAVLGMTRTGKSNMVKQTVAVVQNVVMTGGVKIGQIIYDLNGEYANANKQDKGSIADVYPEDTVRYRMVPTEGFQVLQNNFYTQLAEGHTIIKNILGDRRNGLPPDVQRFLDISFDKPQKDDFDKPGEYYSNLNRWKVRVVAYQALLAKAEFDPPKVLDMTFEANDAVRQAVNTWAINQAVRTDPIPNPKDGLSFVDAYDWFICARATNRQNPLMSGNNRWLDEDTTAILNMLANKNSNDAYMNGYKLVGEARKFHSPLRQSDVGQEIYKHLQNGKIVILDLSVGDPTIRERLSKQIASIIFNQSMNIFVSDKRPPNILVYIEEAHNLIGKGLELTETWPRLAKEGAKYGIGLIYATQEVSSVHPNILANTENWFVSHLNNSREIRELSAFYDFEDFSRSLLRAQDVGFARVKTLSSPFVMPVQINLFDPQAERERAEQLKSTNAKQIG